MVTVSQIVEAIDAFAPFRAAFPGDSVGLQVGDPSSEVTKAVVSLDRSFAVAQYAVEVGAEAIVCHHPLIFRPLATITTDSAEGKTALHLIRNNIAFIAAHTNWDVATGGINDALATQLGLTKGRAFGDSSTMSDLKLVVFVPSEAADRVLDALSNAGAGQIGAYSRCAFISEGTGTFKPEEGANPVIGTVGQAESTPEIRIEMVVPGDRVQPVESALRSVHPYEEPAYDFFALREQKPWPIGRIGSLPSPYPLGEVIQGVSKALTTRCTAWGDIDRQISQIAVVGGSGDESWRAAQNAGADLLVTGEVRQHIALEAVEHGFSIICAGHYATEAPGVRVLTNLLKHRLPSVDWVLFEPQPGKGGRPL